MNAIEIAVTFPYRIQNGARAVVDFLVNNVIASNTIAIRTIDLSELRNSLRGAFLTAEAAIRLRGSFLTSSVGAVSKQEVEKINAYIEQRAQALEQIAEFEQIKGHFTPRYAGRYVAFYNGDVVDSDTNREVLARRFYETYGNVPVCISKVSEEQETLYISTPFFPARQ